MKYINENPTKTEKILFEKYGLYLIYKDEDSYRYAPIHIENQYVYPSSVEVECEEHGFGNYWQALKEAAGNARSFGATSDGAWLGTVDGSDDAWCVDSGGDIYYYYYQSYDFVVAPAFNLDLSKIEIVGDEIMIKAMSAPLGNTILFENQDATSVQKQMFLHYGLYLEGKNGEIEKYVVVHTGTKHFPERFYISSNDIEADCNIKFYKDSETFEINKICGDLELLQLLADRMKELS